MTSNFSHFDDKGKSRMVDVSEKSATSRMARAEGFLTVKPETLHRIKSLQLPKGDPFETARIAGIMAAKNTARMIPMCHPLLISHVAVELKIEEAGIRIEAEVRCKGSTGVEMEALTAVTVAGLTLYDMCKAIDKTMSLTGIRLLRKEGGKSGTFSAD